MMKFFRFLGNREPSIDINDKTEEKAKRILERRKILEAIKWAQEHHNIVGGIIAGAADSMNARQQLMNHFGLWVKIRQNLSKKFYNPDIQTVIKIQKRSIMKMTGTFKVL